MPMPEGGAAWSSKAKKVALVFRYSNPQLKGQNFPSLGHHSLGYFFFFFYLEGKKKRIQENTQGRETQLWGILVPLWGVCKSPGPGGGGGGRNARNSSSFLDCSLS